MEHMLEIGIPGCCIHVGAKGQVKFSFPDLCSLDPIYPPCTMNSICLVLLIAVSSPVACTAERLGTVVIAVSFQKLHLRGTRWVVCLCITSSVSLSDVLYICQLKIMATVCFTVMYSKNI